MDWCDPAHCYSLKFNTIKEEREEDVTTDSDVDSEDRFDPDSDSNFDEDIDGDEDMEDENM
jgi:hypothetical protein